MRRAVKYCGGCNPRYDRVALVRELERRLGQPLPPARPGEAYDQIYVICGCSARCADLSGLTAGAFLVWDSDDLSAAPGH